MYLSLWVCWSVPIYLPNLGRTGEGQSQTVTFKTFELERKAGTKQGVFCHCSPHLCPSFPVPRSFRPLPAPPTSPLPSVEDRSVSLSCPLSGLIARAPLCTRRAPGYQRLCSSGPGGQLASSKGAAGKALLTGPRLHRMNSPHPPSLLIPSPAGARSSAEIGVWVALLVQVVAVGFLWCHKESIAGDARTRDCGVVRFICGTICGIKGVPLGL